MSDVIITMTRDELAALIDERVKSALDNYVAQSGVKRLSRGVTRVRPDKLYAGLSGHYFEVDVLKLGDVDADMAMRLLTVLADANAFEQDSALARAIKSYAANSNKVIMWAPNQDYLIVGNHRNGENGRLEEEKFRISQESGCVEDLGHFSPNNEEGVARGLIEVKSRIGFDYFVKSEIAMKADDKMQEKLRKLGGRG